MPTQPEPAAQPGGRKGVVFDIQRFSVHDGPGIRTTVFLKGCPLECLWCHNPESQRIAPEISFERELCLVCGNCVEVCPQGAQCIVGGRRSITREVCVACGKCVEHCYTNALVLKGRSMTVEEVLEEAIKDRLLYEKSGGGITLSGGEPAMQPAFAREVLREAGRKGLHTAIETCGLAPSVVFEDMLQVTELVIFDLKHADTEAHKRLTGAGNEQILSNLERTVARGIDIVVRIPLIPGCNDSDENIAATAGFLRGLRIDSVEIIPYHDFAPAKYGLLDLDYELSEAKAFTEEELEAKQRTFAAHGLEVRIGV